VKTFFFFFFVLFLFLSLCRYEECSFFSRVWVILADELSHFFTLQTSMFNSILQAFLISTGCLILGNPCLTPGLYPLPLVCPSPLPPPPPTEEISSGALLFSPSSANIYWKFFPHPLIGFAHAPPGTSDLFSPAARHMLAHLRLDTPPLPRNFFCRGL